jgi:hypothetical protein
MLPPWRWNGSVSSLALSSGSSFDALLLVMTSRQTWATAAVILLCAGILVIFTDVEVGLVRWVSCGPLSTSSEEQSEICR